MQKFICLLSILAGLTACTSKDHIKQLLKDNPDILTEAIEANPDKVIMALNGAAQKAQEVMAKKRQEDDSKALDESFDKPLTPKISDADILTGPKDAPLTLVIYSDFECPYCQRGFKNEKELEDKYKGKIRVIFKNLPLPMHQQAMIAAQYFEAVRIQSTEKAGQFHDQVFARQQELKKGEAFLKSIAKDIKVDMAKLAKDIKSEAVKNTIEAHSSEAAEFGMQGTPGYVLNGIPVRGAYPVSHFEDIIKKLEEKGKVKL